VEVKRGGKAFLEADLRRAFQENKRAI